MKLTRIAQMGAVAAVAALALAGCASNEGGGTPTSSEGGTDLSGTLSGVGASSQGSAQTALIAAFQTANSDVTINYSPDGSGAGREAFIGGGANFAGSDRAFTTDELADSTFAGCAEDSGVVELPLYISPIAIVFNLEGVDALDLDADTVAKIFSGQITTWNDPAITALNPDVTLPGDTITPVHRADDSGTQENFTDYLAQAAPSVWTWEADGVWPEDLAGEAGSQTSGVVDIINGAPGTIGFVDHSRAEGFGIVSVKVGDEFVEPSAESAAAVVDASPLESGREDFDLAVELDRTTTEAGAYPVTLISYLIGCEIYQDSAIGTLVSAYFSYIASEEGQQVQAGEAGSAPISDDLRTKVEAAIGAIE